MERLGDSLDQELRRFGATGSMPAIVAAWPEAVGEEVARNAWPARISRDGVLHVNTSSSAWSFELTQLAAVVLEQLAARLDDVAPKGLRFAPGHLPEPHVAPSDTPAATIGGTIPGAARRGSRAGLADRATKSSANGSRRRSR